MAEVDPFVRQQLDTYLVGLQDLLGGTGVELPERFAVEKVNNGGKRFPMKVGDILSDGNASVYYDSEAIDRKVDVFTDPDVFADPELRGDIERYYLLGGIVLGALDQNMDPTNRQQVHDLYSFLTRYDTLTDPEKGEISQSTIFKVEDPHLPEEVKKRLEQEYKQTLREVLFSADNNRMIYINTLRFMVGALRHMPCIDSDVQLRMTEAAELELKSSIVYLRQRTTLKRGMAGEKDDDGGHGIDEKSNDSIDEFCIALVFPMRAVGIQRILKIVASSVDDIPEPEEQLLDPREVSGEDSGYHLEG